MGSLLDEVIEQEAEEINVPKKDEKKPKAVSRIATSSDGMKDKQISAKVNDVSWEMFTRINKAQGLSNNSALNMLINKYIRENKGILEE